MNSLEVTGNLKKMQENQNKEAQREAKSQRRHLLGIKIRGEKL